MKAFWAAFGKILVRAGVYAIGHQAVVLQVVADAKSKNIVGILGDAAAIASDVAAPKAQ